MPSHLEQCRYNMVEQQVRPWDVLNDKVLSTLETIPRDQYVPAEYLNLSYADTAIPLNDSQNMMHPILEGRILQLLNLQPEDTVLEIGTGSGYLTACMAHLACHVESIEIDEALAKQAAQSLLAQGVFNISLNVGDGLDTTTISKKYNAIVLTGAVSEVPQALKEALTENGKMFVVTGEAPAMSAYVITRVADNEWSDEIIFETVLKSLVHGEKKAEFKF